MYVQFAMKLGTGNNHDVSCCVAVVGATPLTCTWAVCYIELIYNKRDLDGHYTLYARSKIPKMTQICVFNAASCVLLGCK